MQIDCSICFQRKSFLYNFQCPSCMEAGFGNKLACKPCQRQCEACPFCRTPLQPEIVQTSVWRFSPKLARHFAKKKVVPMTSEPHRPHTPHTCWIILWFIKIALSKCLLVYGIGCVGFFFGKGICGRNCIVCYIAGAAGSMFTLVFYGILRYTAHNHPPEYLVLCMGNACCTLWFAIVISLCITLNTTCELTNWLNLVWLIFIVPWIFVIGLKLIEEVRACTNFNSNLR